MPVKQPVYEKNGVTLYHGDTLELLPQLEISGQRHLITDPPYYGVKSDDWDNQWKSEKEFLDWTENWFTSAVSLMGAASSIWVFASPKMSAPVEVMMRDHVNVLNSLRWVKDAGWHKRQSVEAARRFMTPWETMIFSEINKAEEEAGESVRNYLRDELAQAGLTGNYISSLWRQEKGTKSNTTGHWFSRSQWRLPNEEQYDWLRSKVPQKYQRELSSLKEEVLDNTRIFNVEEEFITGVIDFPTVPPRKGKHPCEKPQELLRWMINSSTRPGDVIIDPFAGSGSTLLAAQSLGRRVVGIEAEDDYCEKIIQQLESFRLF